VFGGALIHTKDITEAIKISNQIAPEHLELCVKDPESMLDGIKHAGAIFMGKNTACKPSPSAKVAAISPSVFAPLSDIIIREDFF
jgi:hypothetical protein